jgi:hypothetical protein
MQKRSAHRSLILFGVALLAWTASAQTPSPLPKSPPALSRAKRIEDAVAKVKSGNYNMNDIEVIALAPPERAAEVLPYLKKQFAGDLAADQDSAAPPKESIGAGLILLGDQDDLVWNYLAGKAIPAAKDDAPFFLQADDKGHFTKDPSPAFLQWAVEHNLSIDQAAENEAFDYPGAIMVLGIARDARAIPILREALSSRNYLTVSAAAQSLANMGDKDSIPLIIQACSNAPLEMARMIAVHLVYFDDPAAQRAVDQFVPKDLAAEARKNRAEGFNAMGMGPH